MATYSDLGQWALATLKANVALLALVVDGADGVFESGKLIGRDLELAQKTRLDSSGAEVLAIQTIDTGEHALIATCSVFICDRGQGYASTRTAREAVISALINQPVVLARGAHIVQVQYVGRTGHARYSDFDLYYERVDFEGALVVNNDIYT